MRLKYLNLYQLYKYFLFTRPFLKKTFNPKNNQFKLLSRVIKDNKYTKFGVDYNFNEIKSICDFQKFIPILQYNDISKYVEDAKKSIRHSLIYQDVIYFAISSGTTDKPKFIPHTKNYISLRKKSWEIWINSLFYTRPKTFSIFGGILTFTAKPFDNKTLGNIKYGSISGKIHDLQPKFVKSIYAVPNEVLLIDDFKLKYYLSMLFSIRKDLRLIVTPNPSTLIIFAKKFDKYYYQLINDLKNNRIEMLEKSNIDEKLKKQILDLFQKKKKLNYKLHLKLKRLKTENKVLLPKHIFPNIESIGTWMGGPMSIYLNKLYEYYGKDILIRDIGYMASEGRFSIPIYDSKKGDGIIDIENNFYEFIEVKNYDKNIFDTKLIDELKQNEKYYIIITNENGLYRYFIDDIIEVKGFYNKTPIISFVQKGKYISSLTGEKISEWEIIHAFQEVFNKFKINYHTFFTIPTIKNDKVYYKYFIEFEKIISKNQLETLETHLDNILKNINIEYKEKRDSERISKIKISQLKKNSLYIIKNEYSKNNLNDSQIKIPKLIVLEKDKQIFNNLLDKKLI